MYFVTILFVTEVILWAYDYVEFTPVCVELMLFQTTLTPCKYVIMCLSKLPVLSDRFTILRGYHAVTEIQKFLITGNRGKRYFLWFDH